MGLPEKDLSSAREHVNHLHKEGETEACGEILLPSPPFLRLLRSSVLNGFPRTSSGCRQLLRPDIHEENIFSRALGVRVLFPATAALRKARRELGFETNKISTRRKCDG